MSEHGKLSHSSPTPNGILTIFVTLIVTPHHADVVTRAVCMYALSLCAPH